MTQAEMELKEQMLKTATNVFQVAKIIEEHLRTFDTVLDRLDRLEAVVEGMAIGKTRGSS
jgi:hypothetical protein